MFSIDNVWIERKCVFVWIFYDCVSNYSLGHIKAPFFIVLLINDVTRAKEKKKTNRQNTPPTRNENSRSIFTQTTWIKMCQASNLSILLLDIATVTLIKSWMLDNTMNVNLICLWLRAQQFSGPKKCTYLAQYRHNKLKSAFVDVD